MKTLNLLAMDFGASNGRGCVGRFDGEKLTMEEVHRFGNDYVDVSGSLYWDVLSLFMATKTTINKFALKEGKVLSGIGIDTWGVDYGLLDRRGQLLGNPICYRTLTDKDMEAAWGVVSRRELFDRTGIAHLKFNTVYQLYARARANDPLLEIADKLLMMPDLLAYFLTGEIASEYTNATTTMLYDPIKKNWSYELIDKLMLPRHIFTQITPSCTKRGMLLDSIADELGCGEVPVLSVGSHDTASAIAAVPGRGTFAYCSSGTWSLFGIETDAPIINDAVYDADYSNEGTIQGGFRPLKNIMGLWIIQECRKDWIRHGQDVSWDELVQKAAAAQPLRSIIDPDYTEFFSAGQMEKKIQRYCERTKQPIPQTQGEIARCIYESLALKYRWAIERLDEIRGERHSVLHIVGGGAQNKLLNQFVANALGRPVFAGPIEGACIGNLLGQAMALGEIGSIDELRDVVCNSFAVEEYLSAGDSAWDDAYGRLLKLLDL